MKKLLTICLTLVPCVLMAAANKIKMVSYFPVPYVAYSRVSADQMDIGLTQACSMKLGCEESPQPPLKTPAVNVQSGKLELNGGLGILGNTIGLGTVNSTTGHLAFSNVRINAGTMESINNAETMTVTELNLFNRAFPSCNEANSESNGQVSWQMLELNGASNQELYLVCGTPSKTGSCKGPTHNGDLEYTEDCPEGYTGNIVYTWVPEFCRYLRSDNCTKEEEETCFDGLSVEWTAVPRGAGSSTWKEGPVEASLVCGAGAKLTESLDGSTCEVGKKYLYRPHQCQADYGVVKEMVAYGGYCLTCALKAHSRCISGPLRSKAGRTCVGESHEINNGSGNIIDKNDDIIVGPGIKVTD